MAKGRPSMSSRSTLITFSYRVWENDDEPSEKLLIALENKGIDWYELTSMFDSDVPLEHVIEAFEDI